VEPWELEAREAIRETIARYAHYADRGRFAELVALFTADGTLEIDGRPPLAGHAAILAFLASTQRSMGSTLAHPYIRHHVSSLTVELHGPDDARAASYFLAITERGADHWGRYRDRLGRVGEQWLFRHRHVRVDGHGERSWRATRPAD
jgi:hypothetical protein